MAWTGFSEDQIRRMKETGSKEDNYTSMKASRGPTNSSKRGRPLGSRSRAPPTVKKTTDHGREKHLPDNQRLMNLPSNPESEPWETNRATTEKKGQNGVSKTTVKPPSTLQKEVMIKSNLNDQESENPVLKEEASLRVLDEDEGKQRELTKLQQLQEQQMKMEEENKKKKALLFQALENRKKKTQEEAKRLAFVQKELHKIDNLLTNDVSILRDKIEEASRNFTEGEKRYQNAEKEFIAAKIYLHKMEEKKEALTEHLFTIIHQNELRKAKKLEELVNSLDSSDMKTILEDTQGSEEVPSSKSNTNDNACPVESGHDGKVTNGTTSPTEPVESSEINVRSDNVIVSNSDSVAMETDGISQKEEKQPDSPVTTQVETSPSIPEKSQSKQLEADKAELTSTES